MAALKVWGVTLVRTRGQDRAIVAATSRQAAAKALGITVHFLDGYASVTGNAEEILIATATPGVVFVRPLDDHKAAWEEARRG